MLIPDLYYSLILDVRLETTLLRNICKQSTIVMCLGVLILKSDSHPKKTVLIESSLKMIKSTFHFNSKALFILKIFKFLS